MMRRRSSQSSWVRRWPLVPMLLLLAPVGRADEDRHAETVERLERRLEQDPDNPAVHYNLGTALYRADAFERAEESLNQAVAAAQAPLRGRASYNLGNTRYRLGRAQEETAPDAAASRYRQALEDYRTAVRQDPGDQDARFNYELVERRLNALEAKREQQQAHAQQGDEGEQQQDHAEQGAQQQPAGAHEPQPAHASDSETSEEQAQAGAQPETLEAAQPDRQEGVQQEASQAREPLNTDELSPEAALRILDTLRREESDAPIQQRDAARGGRVEQDW